MNMSKNAKTNGQRKRKKNENENKYYPMCTPCPSMRVVILVHIYI